MQGGFFNAQPKKTTATKPKVEDVTHIKAIPRNETLKI